MARTARLRPRPELSLTTNAIGLARLAGPLREAGLDRVNVSLDTLRPDTFLELAQRDRLNDVLAGLAAAAEAGLTPVKVNAVLMRGVNDDEAPACCGSAWTTATSCGSSSRCRSTPSTAGGGTRW